MKSQFKRADASGARYALVFGQEEIARFHVGVKNLRRMETPQEQRPLDNLAALSAHLKSTPLSDRI
jgi:histidyl-tRNA synthetase